MRIYLVNAGPNEFSGFHPIAGIWDKVYPSGNPKNVLTAMQNYTVAPGDAATFDIISPVEGANALVNHSMRAALSGAIAISCSATRPTQRWGTAIRSFPADRQRAQDQPSGGRFGPQVRKLSEYHCGGG